jgi:transposase
METHSPDMTCPSCIGLRAELDALKHLVLEMRQSLDALQHKLSQAQAELAQTQSALVNTQAELARARKNSSNSSKPPSSDIVKAPRPSSSGRRKKRKIGGQPGHNKHERLFSLSDADQQHTYELATCPHCASVHLEVWPGAEKITYQYELINQPIRLHAHQRPAYWCSDCRKTHHAPLPVEVSKGGLVGPELTALIGYLKGNGHMSYATIQSLLDDGLRCSLSGGMLVKVVQKVSQALTRPYEEMVQALPQQKTLNIDETSHPENGKLLWNWGFRTPDFTLFTIEDSRGAQVLEDLLGTECEATLGSDYYSSYRAFMKKAPVTVQFCLAHLIREARFIAQSSTKTIANYGQRVLDGLKALFKLIHQREKIPPDRFHRRLEQQRDKFLRQGRRTKAGGQAAVLAKRFRTHGREYFTFITCPDIGPTNNVAERAIRFCVIDRLITRGTRGLRGRQWCERIWTTRATCAQKSQRLFRFIREAVQAHFAGTSAPSLLVLG